MRLPDTASPTTTETVTFSIEDDPSVSPVACELELSPLEAANVDPSCGAAFILRGSLAFTYTGECGRCLAPVSRKLKSHFESVIDLKSGMVEARDIEAPPEEGLFTMISPTEIDLSEELRQRVYLAIPHILYCRKECKGLCSVCGCDLNKKECGCAKETGSGHFSALRGLLDGNSDPN